MNANAIHNILNILGLIVGVLLTTDLQALGVSAATAVTLAAWFILADKVIKLAMNLTRDGVTGLFSQQPPVKK
jgi:hypothetical protein